MGENQKGGSKLCDFARAEVVRKGISCYKKKSQSMAKVRKVSKRNLNWKSNTTFLIINVCRSQSNKAGQNYVKKETFTSLYVIMTQSK